MSSGVARTALAVYLSACEQAQTSVIVEFLDALHDGSRQCFLSDRQPPLRNIEIQCIAEALKQPHHLRVLDLYSNDIDVEGIGYLMDALIRRPNVLRELRLGNLGLDDEAATSVATMMGEHPTGLRVLDMSQNSIGDAGCGALARMLSTDLSPVLELSLHSNQMGPASATAVQQLVVSDRLRHLHLGRNHLGDATAAAIAQVLPNCRVISTLDLSENNIGLEGGRALAQALTGPGGNSATNGVCLQRLNLRGNNLDREALVGFIAVVRENRSLTQLFLGCNDGVPRGEETVEMVKALLDNDMLLLLDIVGWPLPSNTALSVADEILSSNTCVRAIVSDAFSDVFEFIDGANHERTLRGQPSIYFGLNEYLGASAVAAATTASGRRSDSVPASANESMLAGDHSTLLGDGPRPSAALRTTPPGSQSRPGGSRETSEEQLQQQRPRQQTPPLTGSSGTAGAGAGGGAAAAAPSTSSRSSPDFGPPEASSGFGTQTSAVFPVAGANSNRPTHEMEQQTSASFGPPQQQDRGLGAGGGAASSNSHLVDDGRFAPPSPGSGDRRQQLQQQAARNNDNNDELRQLAALEERFTQIERRVGYDPSPANAAANEFPQLLDVCGGMLESLKRAHAMIAELQRRKECRCNENNSSNFSRGANPNTSSYSNNNNNNNNNNNSSTSPSRSSPWERDSGRGGPGGGGVGAVGGGARDGSGVSSPGAPPRRGEPGGRGGTASSSSTAPSGDQRYNNSVSNSNNNSNTRVPPLDLRRTQPGGGAASHATPNNNARQQQRPGSASTPSSSPYNRNDDTSPIQGVATSRGPGGRRDQPVSSIHRTDRSASERSPSGPVLHPYWTNNSPERQRALERATDELVGPRQVKAEGLPQVRHLEERGADCPTPNLQHSQRVEHVEQIGNVPAPQSPPPRPHIPRATT